MTNRPTLAFNLFLHKHANLCDEWIHTKMIRVWLHSFYLLPVLLYFVVCKMEWGHFYTFLLTYRVTVNTQWVADSLVDLIVSLVTLLVKAWIWSQQVQCRPFNDKAPPNSLGPLLKPTLSNVGISNQNNFQCFNHIKYFLCKPDTNLDPQHTHNGSRSKSFISMACCKTSL